MTLTHIALFAGIGGDSLAAKWAGFKTVLFVEIDGYCQKVLKKHWPDVPIVGDIRGFDGREYRDTITLITGGFPCQDLSTAGRKTGIHGGRSGLWGEFLRIIAESQPEWIAIENVYQSWRQWMPIVRRNLASFRYASLPVRLSASQVGAKHKRTRGFVIANTDCHKLRILSRWSSGKSWEEALQFTKAWDWAPRRLGAYDGIPYRVDRLKGLGNAIVPQQIYPILKGIADIEFSK